MKRLSYLGILKESFLAYSSPVRLISRKVTKNKTVVTDLEIEILENLRIIWLIHY